MTVVADGVCSVGCGRPAPAGEPCVRCRVGRRKRPPAQRSPLVEPVAVPPAVDAPWTLGLLGAPAVAFAVRGVPGPQGSKSFKGISEKTGKAILAESSKKVPPWRRQVRAAAVAAMAAAGRREPILGPLVVDFVFTMPKGVTLPKWLDWHERYPDVSKLARSTEDALTRGPDWHGVWKDDGQVCAYRRLEKRFQGSSDRDALPHPGAVVRVWSVPERLLEDRKARVRLAGAARRRGVTA